MGIVIDGAGIQGFAVVPAGTYNVTLSGQNVKKTAAGDDMLVLKMTIVDADDPEQNGQNLFRNFVLKGGSLNYLKEAMIAFDCDPEVFSGPFDLEETIGELMGNTAQVDVDAREYDGKAQANVKKIYALGF